MLHGSALPPPVRFSLTDTREAVVLLVVGSVSPRMLAVWLQIISTTNTRVGHDGCSTARFVGGACVTVPTATRSGHAVERMISPELVAHFMCHVVDIKSITDGSRQASDSLRLSGTVTN